MLTTFDSNTWRAAVDPSRFPSNPEHVAFVSINSALKSGRLQGVLSETVFTLEGITRADRKSFLAKYHPQVRLTEEEISDGMIQLGLGLGPDVSAHPGNNPYLTTHLKDALALGFKLLRCPRAAGITNNDLKDEWFLSTSNEYTSKFGEVARRLVAMDAGIAQIKAIGNTYATPGDS